MSSRDASIGNAAGRWPDALGDTVLFGCGHGETARTVVTNQAFRSLLLLDTGIDTLREGQAQIPKASSVEYATISGDQNAIRDAVADSVFGFSLLAGIGDVRAFLALVHRVLRPGGRAAFVVPNRRYHEALSLAMAEALVQRHARDGAWPADQQATLELLSQTRHRLVHRTRRNATQSVADMHLFDSENLEDIGLEIGFASAEMLPLDPDPAGAETIRRLCLAGGAPNGFAETFAALAASVGQPYFTLLGRQDWSASMLLWLTKAAGPKVLIFRHRRPPAEIPFSGSDVALGGAAPRWSVELFARDTDAGIELTVGGWCLCNTDVLWVRLTLDGVPGYVPVWRPHPDVHDVMNRKGLYHPLNTLCSGLESELMFDGVHPSGSGCPFRLEVMLSGGLILVGPAPETLTMNEQVIITH